MFMRVLENTDRCMQRLGFLKFITYKCSLRDSTTLNLLGKELIEKSTKKFNAKLTTELKDYIKFRLTDRIYKNLKDSIKNLESGQKQETSLPIELQDLYLSSSQIPSKTGKLISDDWRKYPYLASSLGLIRKGSYSLLVRGKVFLEFVTKQEIDSYNRFNPDVNPFYLSTKQRILLLYSLLEKDGDVLKPLYFNLTRNEGIFSDREAGNFLPDIYRTIASSYNSKTRTGADKDRIQRLIKSAETIENWKDKSYTGKGAREKSITVRLEPFVDLNLLQKSDSFRYEYSLSQSGKSFFQSSSSSDNVDSFLNNSFFKILNQSFHYEATAAIDDEIKESIFEAFEKIKSPLGYAPIREIALLAAIRSFVDKRKYFEVGQASQLIVQYQKSHPYAARFQVDRSGAAVYVKFLKEVGV